MLRCVLRLAVWALCAAGCGCADTRAAGRWNGTMDTLPSGHIVVRNPAASVWVEETAWRVTEEARIGSVEGSGPATFGRIHGIAVDAAGRIWVLDGQAQELRVFDTAGAHVRTIGRRGGGPGEFSHAVSVEIGPDRNVWVMDPQNNRLSVFDTAGNYLDGKHALGGFVILPWPGGFDDLGRYYAPLPLPKGDFRLAMIRFNSALQATDTLEVPTDPKQRDFFELRSDAGRMISGVPFQGNLAWRLSRAGTIWGMVTDEYRLFELADNGDTLRTIIRPFTPLPVTDADRETAREEMKWFIERGGQVDWSKLPSSKPATEAFFFDDEGNIWVEPVTEANRKGRVRDVFDPEGRFLGTIELPFALQSSPAPTFRAGTLYGVVHDELEVPFVVRARIDKPTN